MSHFMGSGLDPIIQLNTSTAILIYRGCLEDFWAWFNYHGLVLVDKPCSQHEGCEFIVFINRIRQSSVC